MLRQAVIIRNLLSIQAGIVSTQEEEEEYLSLALGVIVGGLIVILGESNFMTNSPVTLQS